MDKNTPIRKHDPRKQPQSIGPIHDTKSGNRTGIDAPPPAPPEGPAHTDPSRSKKARVVR